jgi:hypothetical protein
LTLRAGERSPVRTFTVTEADAVGQF